MPRDGQVRMPPKIEASHQLHLQRLICHEGCGFCLAEEALKEIDRIEEEGQCDAS